MDIFNVLTLIGGLALFLFGMNFMGKSLETLSGSKLENILERLTSNKFKGLLVGILVTMVIQSSSATTVMVVGFVNSGIMKLGQAIGIIMGANVGTTITSWILSLTGIESSNTIVQLFKPTSFTPILALIGIVLLMMSKSDNKKQIGNILLGFAVLMYGMTAMSDAVKPLAGDENFAKILLMFENPLLGVLAGAVLTAVIQSSSASIGILQALSATGAVTYGAVVPIILGQNIGTCATAMISSVGANKNARRAALVHLYFNIIGAVLFMVVYYSANAALKFAFVDDTTNAVGIAVVHTVFNLFATILLYPFTGVIEKLAYLTVKEDEVPAVQNDFAYIDERFLARPAFAIEQCRKVACDMAILSKETLFLSFDTLGHYKKKAAEYIRASEEKVDTYEDRLGTYLVQLGTKDLLAKDSQSLTVLLHCIGDFERISDHAINILETSKEMHKKELVFTEKSRQEIDIYLNATREVISLAIDAFVNNDLDKAREVEPLEEVIDNLQKELKKRQVKRLRKGKYTIEMGFVLSDILNNVERIADHCSNIAICLIQINENNFDMHEYIDTLKHLEDEDFKYKFTVYSQKYMLP